MSLTPTKYEIVRILGTRATQIANGAKPMIDVGNLMDPLQIAKKELMEKRCPIMIIRNMPDGTKVTIKCQ